MRPYDDVARSLLVHPEKEEVILTCSVRFEITGFAGLGFRNQRTGFSRFQPEGHNS